jgi:protoporphyrinogen/coproporphyrinogen III oxidase
VKVVVVGAGIAGLAAAWEISRSARGVDLTILESERRPGGVVVTHRSNGFLAEGGPDGFLASEPELPVLAAELGIADRLIQQRARGTQQWTGTALAPIEEGTAAGVLGIDTKGADLTAGFRSFAAGMAEPVLALAERLGGSIRYAQGVSGITQKGSHWRVAITGGAAVEAGALILAVPAYASGRLLAAVGVPGARQLAEVMYLPSITVSLAYRTEQLGRKLEGAGFIVPRELEDRIGLRACTFASEKFPGRAPAAHVLLRAFLTPGAAARDAAGKAHAALRETLSIEGNPVWSREVQWERGLPRYRAHHQAHVAALRRGLRRLPPLTIAGAGYDGAGVSACVRSGREAAAELLRRAS